MNFSVKNNRLKLSNSYDVSGSINTTSLLVGTDVGIDPSSTIDVSGSANISGNLSVDTNTLFVNASNNRIGIGTNSAAKPTSNTWTISSDQRVKENIENADLDRCNEIVENLCLKLYLKLLFFLKLFL
jgi:hypothetical protein